MASTPDLDHNSDPVRILPIPPALEFPYPRNSAGTSANPSLSNVQGRDDKSKQSPHTQSALNQSSSNSKPNSSEHVSSGITHASTDPVPRPSVAKKRGVTERPPPTHRPSLLGARRRQTGAPMATFNPALWDTDSDSSSSSDEDAHPRRKSSDMAGRRGKGVKHDSKHDLDSDERYSRFAVGNEGYKTKGRVSKRDGRLNISVKEAVNRGYLAKALGATLKHHLGTEGEGETPTSPRPELSRAGTASTLSSIISYQGPPPPRMNIVIMVIGSRGDIQPFLRLGKLLKEDHGHRVRIATHPAFKDFVEKDSGLEFFSVGGNVSGINKHR